MKKFSFGLIAASVLASPAMANDPSPAAEAVKPEVCATVDASVVCDHKDGIHENCPNAVMTMTAIPGVDGSASSTTDPQLMYMTGVVTDDSAGPTRHQEGENFRDLTPIHTMSLGGGGGVSAASQARFEGLTQNAYEHRGMVAERPFVKDRSTLKQMFFGQSKYAPSKTTLVAGERVRMQKMAQVDKLRDQALASGDVKLMAKADAMEKEVKGEATAKTSTKFSLFGRK
ncbi:MAG TPA: hypothetical protein VM510_08215 [Caulifigura sp.]|jgi:hypothetical protein|nr:hypothetical protein [Caulifigura sp.]